MTTISSAISLISAMITPAVLILASGSLLLTTSQRLSRALERLRIIYEKFETLQDITTGGNIKARKFALLRSQLFTYTKRARYLQGVMTVIIIALCIFVLTSVSIGVIAFTDLQYTWIPATLVMLGTFMLFYATILLVLETRIALFAVREEITYAIDVSAQVKSEM